jgi:hypothetical protein
MRPIEVIGAPVPTTIRLGIEITAAHFVALPDAMNELRLTFDVADRDTGEISSITTSCKMPAMIFVEGWNAAVLLLIKEALFHEAHESIRVNGALVFDPHERGEP